MRQISRVKNNESRAFDLSAFVVKDVSTTSRRCVCVVKQKVKNIRQRKTVAWEFLECSFPLDPSFVKSTVSSPNPVSSTESELCQNILYSSSFQGSLFAIQTFMYYAQSTYIFETNILTFEETYNISL